MNNKVFWTVLALITLAGHYAIAVANNETPTSELFESADMVIEKQVKVPAEDATPEHHVQGAVNYDGLFIDGNGNVGIGTSSPSETLTVDGIVEAKGYSLVAGGGQKVCSPVDPGVKRTMLVVPDTFTKADCAKLTRTILYPSYSLACLSPNGFVLGASHNAPSPNCGW